MNEQYILKKIEEWVDRLQYEQVNIEIIMQDKTLTLNKTKTKKIGF